MRVNISLSHFVKGSRKENRAHIFNPLIISEREDVFDAAYIQNGTKAYQRRPRRCFFLPSSLHFNLLKTNPLSSRWWCIKQPPTPPATTMHTYTHGLYLFSLKAEGDASKQVKPLSQLLFSRLIQFETRSQQVHIQAMMHLLSRVAHTSVYIVHPCQYMKPIHVHLPNNLMICICMFAKAVICYGNTPLWANLIKWLQVMKHSAAITLNIQQKSYFVVTWIMHNWSVSGERHNLASSRHKEHAIYWILFISVQFSS